MELVRQTLLDTVDLLDAEDVDVGLRVWGIAPRSRNNCRDSTLLLPLAPLDKRGFQAALELIRPSGLSPIADSLQQAAMDLPDNGRSTVVLITGGTDSCSGDPCDAAARLIRRGRADRIHIVGLDQPKHAESELDCAGTYHAADDRTRLRNSLRAIFAGAAGADRGRVTVFLPGRNRWVASAELGQSIHLLEGRYDVQIRVGDRVFHWNDFEVRGEVTETAARRP
jgi:pimeloyl-ACP methyl ester carboxylesterase